MSKYSPAVVVSDDSNSDNSDTSTDSDTAQENQPPKHVTVMHCKRRLDKLAEPYNIKLETVTDYVAVMGFRKKHVCFSPSYFAFLHSLLLTILLSSSQFYLMQELFSLDRIKDDSEFLTKLDEWNQEYQAQNKCMYVTFPFCLFISFPNFLLCRTIKPDPRINRLLEVAHLWPKVPILLSNHTLTASGLYHLFLSCFLFYLHKNTFLFSFSSFPFCTLGSTISPLEHQ